MKRKDYQKEKKQTSTKRLIIKSVLLLTLSAFLVIVAYAISLHNQAKSLVDDAFEALDDRDKSDLRSVVVEPTNDNVSILFIGVDGNSERNRNIDNSLSDALIVATFNKEMKTVKMLSIPRDSYVYIPEKDRKDRINHAHSYGGTRGSIDTIEHLLDIPIDYYVKMNFNAFIEVVDAVGGVEVEVPYNRLEKDEHDKYTIQLKKGLQHLDGKHALALARTRMLDNDIERGKRQQMILKAIMKEATSIKSVTKYGDIIDAVGGNMVTNMTFDEMKSFFNYVKSGIPQIDSYSLVGTDDMSRGPYYYILNETELQDVKQKLQDHLEIQSSSTTLTDKSTDVDGSAHDGD